MSENGQRWRVISPKVIKGGGGEENMSLTNIAMVGILLGFMFLVVGFLMEGPQVQAETPWNKARATPKRTKKRVSIVPRRRAA